MEYFVLNGPTEWNSCSMLRSNRHETDSSRRACNDRLDLSSACCILQFYQYILAFSSPLNTSSQPTNAAGLFYMSLYNAEDGVECMFLQ